ncbi:molybdate ABC transporter substrate-binding protein [Paenibacillus sp. NEAU-GSW1]|nr:molybdate ABC transporter substrate-binding protein [Paenibacillus sp. NEAU-GSW1]
MIWLSLAALFAIMAGCGSEKQTNDAIQQEAGVELTISAAASLKDALHEIGDLYADEHNNVELLFNYGASGALQQQIEQGAPADLFLSAAAKNMNALVEQELIVPDSAADLLKNELVIIVPKDAGRKLASISDVMQVKKLAIGIPETVPAGSYAKEALEYAGLWNELEERTVQAKDVRQVLQYVETGNADAGFVYKTDAMASSKAVISLAVDPQSYSPIVYPMGIVKATKHAEEAKQFYTYLRSKQAAVIFEKFGFKMAD